MSFAAGNETCLYAAIAPQSPFMVCVPNGNQRINAPIWFYAESKSLQKLCFTKSYERGT